MGSARKRVYVVLVTEDPHAAPNQWYAGGSMLRSDLIGLPGGKIHIERSASLPNCTSPDPSATERRRPSRPE